VPPPVSAPPGRFRAGVRRYGVYMRPIVYGIGGTVVFRRWAAMAFRILPRTLRRPKHLGHRLHDDRRGRMSCTESWSCTGCRCPSRPAAPLASSADKTLFLCGVLLHRPPRKGDASEPLPSTSVLRMPCRVLQFGVKYFVGTAGAMVLVLALQANLPALRDWRLLYGAPCTRTAPSSGSRYSLHLLWSLCTARCLTAARMQATVWQCSTCIE